MIEELSHALVIGASGGIGAAIVDVLRERGASVCTLSRSADGLDLTSESSIEEAARALHERVFERIIVATGVLTVGAAAPERSFGSLDPEVMARSYAVNAIGPAMLLKHFSRLLPRDRPAVFAVLSARLASIGDNRLGGWMSYRASKAALNQLLRCASVEFGRKHRQTRFVALHPGTVPSDLSEPYARGRFTATPAEAAAQLLDVIDGLQPTDNGGFFAYDGSPIQW